MGRDEIPDVLLHLGLFWGERHRSGLRPSQIQVFQDVMDTVIGLVGAFTTLELLFLKFHDQLTIPCREDVLSVINIHTVGDPTYAQGDDKHCEDPQQPERPPIPSGDPRASR